MLISRPVFRRLFRILLLSIVCGVVLSLMAFPVGAKTIVGPDSPVWSPDGQHIVFLSPVAGSQDASTSTLYVINANGSDAVKLASGAFYEPVWSADGKQLLIEQNYFGASGDVSNTGLDVINVASASIRTLTTDGYRASWSADGKWVYFIRSDGKLYVVNADGSTPHAALPDGLPSIWGNYAWSPDGKRLAFVNAPNPQNAYSLVFYLVNANGSELHQIDTGPIAALAWSPDSRQLAMLSNCGGHSGLCLFNADGTGMHNLVEGTASLSWSSSLAWSPNGKWIAYVHYGQIAIIGADGSNQRVLTPNIRENDDMNAFSPSWSADSQRLVFEVQYVISRITGDPLAISELYTVNSDASNLALLRTLDGAP